MLISLKLMGCFPLLTFTDLQLLALFVLFDSRRCYFSLLAWRIRVNMEVPVLQTMMMTHTNAFVKLDLLGTVVKQVSKSNLRHLLLSLELYFTTKVHFEMTSLWSQMEDNLVRRSTKLSFLGRIRNSSHGNITWADGSGIWRKLKCAA